MSIEIFSSGAGQWRIELRFIEDFDRAHEMFRFLAEAFDLSNIRVQEGPDILIYEAAMSGTPLRFEFDPPHTTEISFAGDAARDAAHKVANALSTQYNAEVSDGSSMPRKTGPDSGRGTASNAVADRTGRWRSLFLPALAVAVLLLVLILRD
jgi:hypothetical protein